MAITNVDLYVLVGEELGLIGGGQALTPDDQDRIARRAGKVRAWLTEEGLVYWIDNVIPDAASLPLAKIIAGQCAEIYGRGPGSSAPYALGEEGYRLLERHVSQRSAKEPVTVDYF